MMAMLRSGNAVVSSVVAVQVMIPTLTQLSAATNLTSVAANTPFTINGTFTDTNGNAIAGATITLQNNSSGTWNNVTTTTTDTNGNYTFSNNESASGIYYYRTAYAGNATYANATSNTVSVQVNTIATQLSAATNLTSAAVDQNFTISGTLNTTSGPVAGATITLQNNSSGTWNNVTTTTTDTNGNYTFSNNESTAWNYSYQTTYAGNATYANAISNTVNVTVAPAVTPTSSPAATGNYLFVRGSDNALWYTYLERHDVDCGGVSRWGSDRSTHCDVIG